MRIAVLSSHTPSLFWFRMEMMQSFLANGHEVYAIGNENEIQWSAKFLEKGIIYKQINVHRNGVNPINDLKTLLSIKDVLKSVNPDKVFTFQAKTVIYGCLAANIMGINEVYPLIAGLGSVFLKEDFKTKIVRKVLTTEYRIAMRKCPCVFFQNEDDVKVFRQHKIIKNHKITMLHGSGVNVEHFSVQPFPKQFGFLCISRLIRDKGVYEYLEACKKVKAEYSSVRCLLVGPYDSNPSALKPEELQLFIDDGVIEYFGEQTDVRPYLAQCNVFVLPSYREGTPKTVLEAMATGRAIITTNVPGCRETVKHGENGYLVQAKNVDELYQKMTELIENSSSVSNMAAIGREMAENIFDVKKVNETIVETMKV